MAKKRRAPLILAGLGLAMAIMGMLVEEFHLLKLEGTVSYITFGLLFIAIAAILMLREARK